MNVLYEENGDFKVGTVLSETDASLQVEAPHGKRTKVKASNVLLRFDETGLSDFLERAHAQAAQIDTDFLWECCGDAEFGFNDLAIEYCGHAPGALEAAGILCKLHSAPIYFHRKGRGRFRAAPAETLKAALAGLERKRQQAEQIYAWAAQLQRFELPDALRPLLRELLYKPDRNRLETKAFEKACEASALSAPKLIEACGALPSTHDYHFDRFLYEHFSHGIEFPSVQLPAWPDDLLTANVRAFSLDDASTTEIDDAMSLSALPNGLMRVGVHIAAPALGVLPGSEIDAIARSRLSTAYMPGRKITMLPPEVVAHYTLGEGTAPPALSLYIDVQPDTLEIVGTDTRVEYVPIAANLRHHQVDQLNEYFLRGETEADVPFGEELIWIYRFALKLEAGRGKASNSIDRVEYSFSVENDRIEIVPRKRGAPLDKLVAELAILVNRSWGKLLDDHDVAAIYRNQGEGKVRMAVSAGEHQGLGVSHYAWSSSPLRRYIDLINQWQLLAVLQQRDPPFARKSEALYAALRDFELTYAAYDEFQRRMEQYWCLRWLIQEQRQQVRAEVVRETLVRFADIPLYTRVPSLPELAPGTMVSLYI
jgi:exoribonuclease-2